MRKNVKAQKIDEIQSSLTGFESAVVTTYQGIKTPDLVSLRHKLRENNIEYKVVKNTFVRRAMAALGHDAIAEKLDGPIAIAIGHEDMVAPMKVMSDYISSSGIQMEIIGGFLPDQWLTPEDVKVYAKLPSKEQAHFLIAYLLQSPVRSLAIALNARREQLEAQA
jgi:large subunit ribosomal protein L10